MLAYYLKFFVNPITRRGFCSESGLGYTYQARSIICRLKADGYITTVAKPVGHWVITSAGTTAHEIYLGVRKATPNQQARPSLFR